MEEYDEHFDFKLADGYSEQEIAARLGDPVRLAAQFEPAAPGEKCPAGKKALTVTGLVLLDILAVLALVALVAFGVVLIAAAAALGGAGVCLLARMDPDPLRRAVGGWGRPVRRSGRQPCLLARLGPVYCLLTCRGKCDTLVLKEGRDDVHLLL